MSAGIIANCITANIEMSWIADFKDLQNLLVF